MSEAASEAVRLRALFDSQSDTTFGLEEELMALDPETFDLAPVAAGLLEGLAGDERFKLELPASQLEIVTAPHRTLAGAVSELSGSRSALAAAVGGRARLAAAGAHPFAAPEGELNRGEHYERIAREYGPIARRQLVCGLHVHVAIAGAERALAVYNAMREYLPELAALGANAPLRGGRDSGLASVRPLISGLLPRQGVPPAFASWEQLAHELAWGSASGRISGSRGWWWELRLHPALGTVEVRVPDAQSRIADVAALGATVAALALWLAERSDAGELPPTAPSWRIAENRWSALRHGVHGDMLDLRTGRAARTEERLHALLDAIEPLAARVGADDGLRRARELVSRNGADEQRAVAAQLGPRAVAKMLSERFLSPGV
jgi:glutamate---cysteine ligase / carboxylate-amine ligase